MKLLRYATREGGRYGQLEGSYVLPLMGVFPELRRSNLPALRLSEVALLAPCEPTRIVACGPGFKSPYRDRPAPDRPMLWHKPLGALNRHEGYLCLPNDAGPPINYEAELAIVIGRTARRISVTQANDYIFGYTCCNDVTRGDFATPGAFVASPYFLHGKTYDGFSPVGPWIVAGLNVDDARITCRVNSELRQDHRTSDRLFSPAQLVSFLSHIGTLNPGDIISMGSPPGVGPLDEGDVCEVEIEGIGILRNRVRASAPAIGAEFPDNCS